MGYSQKMYIEKDWKYTNIIEFLRKLSKCKSNQFQPRYMFSWDLETVDKFINDVQQETLGLQRLGMITVEDIEFYTYSFRNTNALVLIKIND